MVGDSGWWVAQYSSVLFSIPLSILPPTPKIRVGHPRVDRRFTGAASLDFPQGLTAASHRLFGKYPPPWIRIRSKSSSPCVAKSSPVSHGWKLLMVARLSPNYSSLLSGCVYMSILYCIVD